MVASCRALHILHFLIKCYNLSMERIVFKTKDFKEAEEHDIKQNISMTPAERQEAAKKIREKVYGKDNPDVRKYHARR